IDGTIPKRRLFAREPASHIRRSMSCTQTGGYGIVTRIMRPPFCGSQFGVGMPFPISIRFSLFLQKNSLFPEEQGIGCKSLKPLGGRLAKPPQETESGRYFQKFPDKFPVFREFTAPTPDFAEMRACPSRLRRGWREAPGGATTAQSVP